MKGAKKIKAKRGRPPGDPAERRDEKLRVLVTAEEKERMEEFARSRGFTVSTWLRSLGLQALERG